MSEATKNHPPEESRSVYDCLFKPRSIAVIGASNDPLKPGGRVTKNIRDHHFRGDLWAVNAKTPAVLDLPTFQNIAGLPHGPDLALVAIPSGYVIQAIRELADKGAGAVIVLTSGFGEKDEQGKQAEQEMLKIARAANMALIGPNCSGFITPAYKGKFAGIIPDLPGGAVDFISGSGAMVDYVMERATTRGLSFGNVANLGNSVQIGVEDLLQLYDENYAADNARIVLLYLESLSKPAKLLRHARSLARKGCTLVGIKSGVTAVGARAAASHTGAMATSETAVAALFEKAGIIRVNSRAALVNVACVLAATRGELKGKRACIITDAGGPGVMLSDELSRQGLELPLLNDRTREQLARILPAEAATANPIDMLPSRTGAQIKQIIPTLGQNESDRLDVIIVLTGDSGMSDNAEIYAEIALAMDSSPIPVIPMLSSVVSSRSKIDHFKLGGKIYFTDEVLLGRALGKIVHRKTPETSNAVPAGYDRSGIRQALHGHSGALTPETVSGVLQAAGFKLPEQVEVFKPDLLAEGCSRVGYPLAMKVIGPLHKTDVGGVRLGLGSAAEARSAWEALLAIPDARGVLLQPMISGTEVILGASREGEFGHLVMFGLGGIFAEAIGDVNFALAPLTLDECRHMVRSIRSYAILIGVRGRAGMSLEVLATNLQRLGRLVTDFPEINEIDINPLKGTAADLYAIDTRIVVK